MDTHRNLGIVATLVASLQRGDPYWVHFLPNLFDMHKNISHRV